MSKDRSIYVNVFTFLDFMWSLGALPDGKFTTHIILLKSKYQTISFVPAYPDHYILECVCSILMNLQQNPKDPYSQFSCTKTDHYSK